MRANIALISPFSPFALSYGLERHAARCPRTTTFLNPGGYYYSGAASLEEGGADSGLSQRVPPRPHEIKMSALIHDQSSTQARSHSQLGVPPTRGRTCGRRAT